MTISVGRILQGLKDVTDDTPLNVVVSDSRLEALLDSLEVTESVLITGCGSYRGRTSSAYIALSVMDGIAGVENGVLVLREVLSAVGPKTPVIVAVRGGRLTELLAGARLCITNAYRYTTERGDEEFTIAIGLGE